MPDKDSKIAQIKAEVARLGLSARAVARGTALQPHTVLAVLRGEASVQESSVNLIWYFLGLDHDFSRTAPELAATA